MANRWFLADRKGGAGLPEPRLEAARQRFDEVERSGRARRGFHLESARGRIAHADIVGDSVVEHDRFLKDERDVVAYAVDPERGQVDVVEQHAPPRNGWMNPGSV